MYYEKISREVGSGTVDRFDVWVLLKLPRSEVEKERQRQAQEAQQTAAAGVALYREGREQEKQGNVIGALVRYRDALSKAKAVAGSTPTGTGTSRPLPRSCRRRRTPPTQREEGPAGRS